MLSFRAYRLLAALGGVLALAACDPPARPPETFEWAGQAVRFSPPPAGWRREGYNQGGWLGAWFVHEGSVGERILVADHHVIAGHDGRAALGDLLARFETLDERELLRAIQKSRYRTDDLLSPHAAEVAARVNESLDRASVACANGDRAGARGDIEAATHEAARTRIELADVIGRVVIRPEQRAEPERWRIRDQRDGEVAGLPALFVDGVFRSPERELEWQDVYFVHDNHLFTASFLGLRRNLKVFDRVVASIRFADSTAASVSQGREDSTGASVSEPSADGIGSR